MTKGKKLPKTLPFLLLAALFAASLTSIATGPVDIPLGDVAAALSPFAASDAVPEVSRKIVIGTRLPRVLGAILAGAGLAMAGLASQTLFRNPLATPYVIGISGGAAVAASASILLAGGAACSISMFPLGVTGGLAAAFANYALSRGSTSLGGGLLLNGIAINAFCSALISMALFLSNEKMQTLVFWLMGGLWKISWQGVAALFPVTAALLLILMWRAKAMNLALMGERQASDLGVNVGLLQKTLLVAMTVMVSVAVSLTGLIGFVGLVVPHMTRLVVGPGHGPLVVSSALGGALLLLLADLFARTAAAPAEIPVGVVTALLGAPVFVWLLRATRNGGGV